KKMINVAGAIALATGGLLAIPAGAAHAAIAVNIGSASGQPGGTVSFDVTLTGTGSTELEQAAAVTVEIGFDTSTPVNANGSGKPDCTLNPSITKPNTGFAYQPRNCMVGTSCTEVKGAVISLDPNSATTPIPDGVLFTCKFTIASGAAIG